MASRRPAPLPLPLPLHTLRSLATRPARHSVGRDCDCGWQILVTDRAYFVHLWHCLHCCAAARRRSLPLPPLLPPRSSACLFFCGNRRNLRLLVDAAAALMCVHECVCACVRVSVKWVALSAARRDYHLLQPHTGNVIGIARRVIR